jgi:hypothetical protein
MATATQSNARSRRARRSNDKASETIQGTARAGSNGGEGRSPQAAASRARSSRSRGRSSNPSKSNSSRGKGATARNRPAASRTRGRANGSSRSRSSENGSETSARERAAETISSAANNVRDTAAEAGHKVGVPVATGTLGAAAGIAGGVLLGRTIAKRPKKILGITLPHRQTDFSDVIRSINAAGKQLGTLASEVRTARQKAEEIGKVLT